MFFIEHIGLKIKDHSIYYSILIGIEDTDSFYEKKKMIVKL